MTTALMNGVADVIAESIGTECDSTEDMIASMEESNEKIKAEKFTDIVAVLQTLRPCIQALEERRRGGSQKMVVESEINVDGFDWKEAALYLTLCMS